MNGRSRTLVIAAAVLFGVLIVAGGLTAVVTAGTAPHPPNHRPVDASRPPRPPPPSAPIGGWQPVPPATTVPADTPIQQHYDQGFEQGFSSPANEAELARLETSQLSPPAISGGWPTLAVSSTPDGWTRSFVQGLLDIDFARQSRDALGGWLAAEEAPDLMPGIPVGAQDRFLYVSVLEPDITGQSSPIPSVAQWQADAVGGVRWSVSGLQVQLDPQWQSMVDAGWQPRDLHATVEDVSGVLTVTQGATSSTHTFSMVVQLGSARWHDGYGTVVVEGV